MQRLNNLWQQHNEVHRTKLLFVFVGGRVSNVISTATRGAHDARLLKRKRNKQQKQRRKPSCYTCTSACGDVLPCSPAQVVIIYNIYAVIEATKIRIVDDMSVLLLLLLLLLMYYLTCCCTMF